MVLFGEPSLLFSAFVLCFFDSMSSPPAPRNPCSLGHGPWCRAPPLPPSHGVKPPLCFSPAGVVPAGVVAAALRCCYSRVHARPLPGPSSRPSGDLGPLAAAAPPTRRLPPGAPPCSPMVGPLSSPFLLLFQGGKSQRRRKPLSPKSIYFFLKLFPYFVSHAKINC